MKKTIYRFEELADRLRKFYQTPAPVPRRCSQKNIDSLVFHHNAKKLTNNELFLLAYVEEEDGSWRFQQFGQEIMSRGFTYEQYKAFIASITITVGEKKPQKNTSKKRAA